MNETKIVDLPPNCWQHVMTFLTPPDICNISKVNKKLNKIEKRDMIWERRKSFLNSIIRIKKKNKKKEEQKKYFSSSKKNFFFFNSKLDCTVQWIYTKKEEDTWKDLYIQWLRYQSIKKKKKFNHKK